MKNSYKLRVFVGIMAFLLAFRSYAQNNILEKDTTRTGAVTFLRLNPNSDSHWAITESTTALRSLLKLRPQDELRPQDSRRDARGYTHARYAQYYNGIPVEYGVYVVHSLNGIIETLNGEVIKIGALAAASLTEQTALARALTAIGATVYRWQVPVDEKI